MDHEAAFLRNLQLVLAEGDFVSTYKFALLLSLVRWAIEHPNHDEREPLEASALAPHFAELYWPHVLPFRVANTSEDSARVASKPDRWPGWHGVLTQDSGQQIPRVLKCVRDARSTTVRPLHELPLDQREKLYREIAKTIVEQPLWKLQNVRTRHEPIEFIYQRGPTRREILFFPGTVARLAAFGDLIDDLVRSAWLRFIIRHNPRLLPESSELERFLFPDGRASLEVWRPPLHEIQGDKCFYCSGVMGSRSEVDHFLPWSRYPRDIGQNFVLAHTACNQAKKDHLADAAHLEMWCRRNGDPNLGRVFAKRELPQDWLTVWGAARSLYESARMVGAAAWRGGKNFTLVDAHSTEIIEQHAPHPGFGT